MATNNQVFDAAMAGCLAGMMQASIFDTVPADYSVYVNVASAWATALDAQIPLDVTITTPVTSESLQKTNLVQAISSGVWAGRVPTSTVSADYTDLAVAAAAAYQQAALSLVLP